MSRTRTILVSLIACSVVVASAVRAQPEEPPFMKALFPPDLVMRHDRDIELSQAQRQAIKDAVAETQARTLDLRWEMQDAARSLGELIGQPSVDEEAALAAAKRVMDLEGKVKRAHLSLLIRIKNQLEPAQQASLRRLRERD